jgi:hypothetical protein
MAKLSSQSSIVRDDWYWTSNPDGSWPVGVITAAGAAESARLLGKIHGTLKSILIRLDLLGSDGIHELIRHETRRVRNSERLRKGRIAAKRRRTIAAKKGAK